MLGSRIRKTDAVRIYCDNAQVYEDVKNCDFESMSQPFVQIERDTFPYLTVRALMSTRSGALERALCRSQGAESAYWNLFTIKCNKFGGSMCSFRSKVCWRCPFSLIQFSVTRCFRSRSSPSSSSVNTPLFSLCVSNERATFPLSS